MKGEPYRPSWELPPLVWIRCAGCNGIIGSVDRIAERPGKITVYSYKRTARSTTGHGQSFSSLDEFDGAKVKVRCQDCGRVELPDNIREQISAGYEKPRTVLARPMSSM